MQLGDQRGGCVQRPHCPSERQSQAMGTGGWRKPGPPRTVPTVLPAWQSRGQGWPTLLGMLEACALETRGPGTRSHCSQGSFGHYKGLLNALGLGARLSPASLPELLAASGMASLYLWLLKIPANHRICNLCWKAGQLVNSHSQQKAQISVPNALILEHRSPRGGGGAPLHGRTVIQS